MARLALDTTKSAAPEGIQGGAIGIETTKAAPAPCNGTGAASLCTYRRCAFCATEISAEEVAAMGVWKNLTRPKAVGLFIDDGVLYAKRHTTHPDYRLLVEPEQRRAYLAPIPILLHNARVFFDADVVGQRTGAIGVDVGPFIPILPVSLGKKKIFTVSVYTGANDIYRGWSANGKQALRLYRKTVKLINAANKTPAAV